mmetsp:Transcript_75793/g.214283  ORF Transcript_75793/g.214283 Transcript_75793/m.214283 type:complete len:208 (-) Transcript_75793:62-685(-)
MGLHQGFRRPLCQLPGRDGQLRTDGQRGQGPRPAGAPPRPHDELLALAGGLPRARRGLPPWEPLQQGGAHRRAPQKGRAAGDRACSRPEGREAVRPHLGGGQGQRRAGRRAANRLPRIPRGAGHRGRAGGRDLDDGGGDLREVPRAAQAEGVPADRQGLRRREGRRHPGPRRGRAAEAARAAAGGEEAEGGVGRGRGAGHRGRRCGT